MEYKVGQKFRIMTLKEAETKFTGKKWNKIFFDYYGGTVFTIERIDKYFGSENVTLFGTGVDGDDIRIRTKYGEEKVLKPFSCIELENDLFDL